VRTANHLSANLRSISLEFRSSLVQVNCVNMASLHHKAEPPTSPGVAATPKAISLAISSAEIMPPKVPNIQPAVRTLTSHYSWTTTPLIVGAPMRILSGPELAVAISEAGGLGFIGPGEKPEHLEKELEASVALVSQSKRLTSHLSASGVLPIGIGIQLWQGDLTITSKILRSVANSHPPAAVWLFAPRHGQEEIDAWSREIREASPRTRIWVQVAGVNDAFTVAHSADSPDVLVLQGSDAGGHSRTQSASILSLVPEVSDALAVTYSKVPVIAAGGIADGRGAAAALTLGASGVAIGTRFLASAEARINPGYQRAILAGHDGGQTTVRTQLFNHLRGTFGWPEDYDARGMVNASWRDHVGGMSFEQNKELHDEAVKKGENAWGEEEGRTATYAGTNIGLVKEVKSAAKIVKDIRDTTKAILRKTSESLESDT
jgi:nitronate monooxygenase